jgi:hypothetical protein
MGYPKGVPITGVRQVGVLKFEEDYKKEIHLYVTVEELSHDTALFPYPQGPGAKTRHKKSVKPLASLGQETKVCRSENCLA